MTQLAAHDAAKRHMTYVTTVSILEQDGGAAGGDAGSGGDASLAGTGGVRGARAADAGGVLRVPAAVLRAACGAPARADRELWGACGWRMGSAALSRVGDPAGHRGIAWPAVNRRPWRGC